MIIALVQFFIPDSVNNETAIYHEMAFKVSTILSTGLISFLYIFLSLYVEFYDQARQKNIHLHFHRGEALVISTDQLAMERILTNLISNALKYTPSEKNVVIKVVGSQIIIQDEGVGLSDEFKKSLFNIYAQGGGKIIHFKDESNGIGLYIVKELCDQLNFEITAESPGINQGATFTLNLAAHRG